MASAIMADAAELTPKENAVVDIGAWTARGEQDKLGAAFKAGFDAGLTLNEAKELVGQLYAYCGFPRALNAAGTLMKAQELAAKNAKDAKEISRGDAESQRKENEAGQPFVLGDKALEIGTENQTKLCGGPVKGALFDFHPQLDAYLKAHLFGDIFARDTLDWRTREIVTIAALAARPETEPQMKAHIAIGKVNGVTDAQAAEIVRRVQLPLSTSSRSTRCRRLASRSSRAAATTGTSTTRRRAEGRCSSSRRARASTRNGASRRVGSGRAIR